MCVILQQELLLNFLQIYYFYKTKSVILVQK